MSDSENNSIDITPTPEELNRWQQNMHAIRAERTLINTLKEHVLKEVNIAIECARQGIPLTPNPDRLREPNNPMQFHIYGTPPENVEIDSDAYQKYIQGVETRAEAICTKVEDIIQDTTTRNQIVPDYTSGLVGGLLSDIQQQINRSPHERALARISGPRDGTQMR